jgi:hypothetical protein
MLNGERNGSMSKPVGTGDPAAISERGDVAVVCSGRVPAHARAVQHRRISTALLEVGSFVITARHCIVAGSDLLGSSLIKIPKTLK